MRTLLKYSKSSSEKQFIHNYDYVIIGGGTAGCLLANRLSKCSSITVALIEAGQSNRYNPLVHVPVGYLFCMGNPLTDWCFKTSVEKGLNQRSIRYPRGRVLGGCSSINGMIYMRGQENDYNTWATLVNDSIWNWNNCLPYFKKHEDYYGGLNEYHGQGGQWKVAKQRLRYEVLDRVREAFYEFGVPASSDFNKGNNYGCGYFDVNQMDGMRWSSADAFLTEEVLSRPNLTVLTGINVNKLVLSSSPNEPKVLGCTVSNNNNMVAGIGCRKQLILSAGAIGSPAILQRSGIGGQWLSKTDIGPPRILLEGVGENLQDHLQLRLVSKVSNVDTLNSLLKSPISALAMFSNFLTKKQGPLTMAPSQLGAFVKSKWESQWPDLQYHIQPLSLNAFGQPLHPFNGITMSICNLRPTSRGTVRIGSLNHLQQPHITPNYLNSEEDRYKAAHSIRLTRDIMKTAALRDYAPQQYWPGSQFKTEEQLTRKAGDIGTSIFHPCGTCKMGSTHDELAVVDSKLRVRGVENLRVVDASIMPRIASGNINSPTMMIAQRAAQWILNG